MSPSTQPSESDRSVAARDQTLDARAGTFDASSLLDLLARRFPTHRIVMESQRALGPAATLFSGIDVQEQQIVVRVNLGMRSGTTPLPSYFLDLFEEPHAGNALAELVAQIDRALVPKRVAAHHLDATGLLPLSTSRLRRRLLELAKPACPSTLHWLFAAVFPELEVRIERSALARRMPSNLARLGHAVTGVATLGGEASVPVNGFDVILRVADSVTWGDVPWRSEAHRRVHTHILRALAGTDAYLRIVFVADDCVERDHLALHSGSWLGFEPLELATLPLVHVVYEGNVGA